MPILSREYTSFPFGTFDNVDDQTIPDGAASASMNWFTMGDRIQLRNGYRQLGAVISGAGKIRGLHVANKAGSGQSTLTDGLVSFLPMEGNSKDIWGSNNGTDTAMTYGTPYGKIGQGSLFNGSTSHIVLPNTYNINTGTTSYTMSAWIYAQD